MLRFAITALLMGSAMPVTAASWSSGSSGLTGTFTTVNLLAPALPTNTLVTNQYSSQGITFSNATYDPQPGLFAGPAIANYQFSPLSLQFPNISFSFNPGVSAVAFQFASNPGTSQFDAYLGASLVASANFPTDAVLGQWISLTGGGFDSVTITVFGAANAALQATDFQIAGGVPEPASWALMVAGFGLVGGALRRRTATATA